MCGKRHALAALYRCGENLAPTWICSPERAAHNEALRQLNYPGLHMTLYAIKQVLD